MFNVLRRRATVSAAATAAAAPRPAARARLSTASSFVPPDSLTDIDGAPPPPPTGRTKPASPTFYTGRARYFDQLVELEKAANATRQALKSLQLSPLPQFARDALPPLQPVWKDRRAMGDVVGAQLTNARYRRYLSVLNVLEANRNVANVAGVYELSEHISEIVEGFERANKEAVLAGGKRKPVRFDEYGRSYTIGRRKESTARVWMIPVKRPAVEQPKAPVQNHKNDDVAPFLPILQEEAPAPKTVVTTSNILINNTPLNEYFPVVVDRERVIRPFKVAGLLGAYNVFAIARGGGTTGQSGAVSLAIAKGLAAHVPDVEAMLRKAKLMRRDPRMVERKKTGLAKARKAYSWVKR
ncbi:hypothetical protein EIP86_003383 [Pleurotus ostreatoroseus]|nr:hypothetical protein EIP86_003383 [Pleurotus ostreatoroseus]